MNEKPKTGPKTERAKDQVSALITYALGLAIAGLILAVAAWVIVGLV